MFVGADFWNTPYTSIYSSDNAKAALDNNVPISPGIVFAFQGLSVIMGFPSS